MLSFDFDTNQYKITQAQPFVRHPQQTFFFSRGVVRIFFFTMCMCVCVCLCYSLFFANADDEKLPDLLSFPAIVMAAVLRRLLFVVDLPFNFRPAKRSIARLGIFAGSIRLAVGLFRLEG